MLAWPKPSDFDATPKTVVRRSGRIAVVSAVLPLSSHHAIAVSHEADRARVGVGNSLTARRTRDSLDYYGVPLIDFRRRVGHGM